MDELYPIGDVARRTGLSVTTIRFYADAGVVVPTGHSGAGYRLYDVRAIAALELVRTLRELGAGLDEIRRVLAGEAGVRDLAAHHLDLVESQISRLRTRRAVLRTIVRQDSAIEQVTIMHELATLSDDDRDRLVDGFWTEIAEGLDAGVLDDDVPPYRPRLPQDPTTEQLEAWIELADLVIEPGFRQAVRRYYEQLYAPEQDRAWSEEEIQRQVALLTEARTAAEAGQPVDAPPARELARRYVALVMSMDGGLDAAEARRLIAGAEPSAHVDRYRRLFDRYNALVAIINAITHRRAEAPGVTWLHEAVKALPDTPDHGARSAD
ncbi:MerR family transcriptional regulator [Cryptosporangium arvum]|uniref:Putative transcriptional regulator n=1 Tax=Cryptosporangium arvum DSM 44712 TaxID=927661 RepID=A0A010ZV05_9ACTN|nr:MerR family transcriptional regulator [Cryptosporangium arvum]EXG82529.1 putative transcriptional regulator [Cryptosporangium arvum DSM 44712]